MPEVGETVQVRLYEQNNKVVEGTIVTIERGSHGPVANVQVSEYTKPVQCGYHPEDGWYTLKD